MYSPRHTLERWSRVAESWCVQWSRVRHHSPGLISAPGVILLCGFAIITSIFLLLRTQGKKAAVGRRYSVPLTRCADTAETSHREMQIFLIGYILIEICEIFTVGGFPLPKNVRIVCGFDITLATAKLLLTPLVGFHWGPHWSYHGSHLDSHA